jgi:Nose resistant-to-fluoxetine protein, N-terminal domain
VLSSWSSFEFDEEQGNSFDFGNFDKCLAIHKKLDKGVVMSGQYCMVQFYSTSNRTASNPPSQSIYNKGWKEMDKRFGGAICIPSTCPVEVIPVLMSKVFNATDFRLVTDYKQRDFCRTHTGSTYKISSSLITLVVVTSVLIILVTMSTILSWFISHQADKPKHIATVFSLSDNLKNLTNMSQPSGDIKCLHGMKFLATLTIIYFHTCYHHLSFPHKNPKEIFLFSEHFLGSVVNVLSTSVELFFVVSGLLITQKILKDIDS